MKAKIFDITFRANDTGLEGYEKPSKAHIVNTKNIAARENRVYLDNLTKGDNVSNERVEISTIKRGKKKSPLKRIGLGGMSG